MSIALSIQKEQAIFSLKAREKGLLQPKTRHQMQRKPEAIFVKEAHIENAAPAIRIFSTYLHVLQ